MSRQNLEVVRQAIDAYVRRDVEAMRRVTSADLELDWSASRGWLAGVYRGFEEAWRWFQRKGVWEGGAFTYSVEELLGGERHAATLLRISGSGREWRQVAVYRVEGGQIVEVWLYEEPH